VANTRINLSAQWPEQEPNGTPTETPSHVCFVTVSKATCTKIRASDEVDTHEVSALSAEQNILNSGWRYPSLWLDVNLAYTSYSHTVATTRM